ncbi:hypothetical protein PINS_up010811 [Pythium insidiosum]|nr:hypothetical protein PINS_up010811 [Pythium insidiosum]
MPRLADDGYQQRQHEYARHDSALLANGASDALPDADDVNANNEEQALATTWRFTARNANGNSEKKQASVSFSEPPDREGDAAEPPPAHHRRRNRLEARLEELQRDVASLTLRLRASNNNSTTATTSAGTRVEPSPAMNGTTDASVKTRSTRHSDRDHDADDNELLLQQRSKKRRSSPGLKSSETVKSFARKPVTEVVTPPTVSSSNSKSRVTPTRSVRPRTTEVLDTSISRGADGSISGRSTRGGRDATRALRELQVMAVERDQLRMDLEQVGKTYLVMVLLN